MLVDQSGRVRIFHGVNAVYKTPPYHPSVDSFDPFHSLSEEDMLNFYEWGFNVVRLGVLWIGVEPVQNQVNQTYLDVMGSIVQKLDEHNIYSLVDSHQDAWNRHLCGEGFPNWTIVLPSNISAFPVPVAPPYLNNSNDVPTIEECLSQPFWSYNYSEAISYLFQCLYDNQYGLQDSMVKFWTTLASYFKDYPSVLGYDLINEPWPGDIYQNIDLLLDPIQADIHHLYPLYENITAGIRSVDTETIITYEPMGTDYATPVGFSSLPDQNSALNYHVYCGLTNTTGVPTNFTECIESWDNEMTIRMNDIKRLNTVGLMSEFGDLGSELSALALLRHYVDEADRYLQSTMYWQYKFYNDLTTQTPFEGLYDFRGELITEKLNILSRTYAYAIAGTPQIMKFSPDTSVFEFEYTIDINISKPTEIYLNQKMHYPDGYTVTFNHPSWATYSPITPTNYISITLTDKAIDKQSLQITITKNYS